MELNQNEQLEVQVAENAVTEQPVKPEKTGKDKAIGALSKVFAILALIMAVGGMFAITFIVLKYNMDFVFGKELSQSELPHFLATAELYKGYAKKIIYVAISSMPLSIVALILNKIQAKKGFNCTLVKVLGIIALAVAGVTILNCVINLFMFGRYNTRYYYV